MLFRLFFWEVMGNYQYSQPHFTDPRLIQTPDYYGQFSLFLGTESLYIVSKFIQPTKYRYLIITDSFLCPYGQKAFTFSLNSTCLIRTPSNADNGLFSCPMSRFSYKANLAYVDTLLLSTVCCNKPLFFGVKKPVVDINVNVPSST